MKYILIIQLPFSEWKSSRLDLWPPQDIEAHIDFLRRFNQELSDSGELAGVEALAGLDETKIVRAGTGADPVITDGPFPESKEFLAGYWIVDVASAKRACEIAARASAAPGPGGAPLNMPIEVRRVINAPKADG